MLRDYVTTIAGAIFLLPLGHQEEERYVGELTFIAWKIIAILATQCLWANLKALLQLCASFGGPGL